MRRGGVGEGVEREVGEELDFYYHIPQNGVFSWAVMEGKSFSSLFNSGWGGGSEYK